ncbi:MAG: hypothetical protein MZV63_28845 [Marinilabiliales bacterium]|nr:hypothetical protein [Marinilabiliales bacterium]
MQARQFVDDLFRQNIHAAADELAQFDHHAAQFHGQRAELPREPHIPIEHGAIHPGAKTEVTQEYIVEESSQQSAGKKLMMRPRRRRKSRGRCEVIIPGIRMKF